MHETSILHTAFKIRNILSDFIDCLILSSAISQCDALITEDTDMQTVEGDENYQELIATKNPKFKIYNLEEIL